MNNNEDKINITIDGIKYVREDKAPSMASNSEGLPYVVIRSKDSGVHTGYLKRKRGSEIKLLNARRIWYWKGAATLSELSQNGVKNPNECKIPAPVPEITVLGVCEIIPMTEKAQKSIEGVPEWRA